MIELSNVCFSYNNEKQILSNINVKIEDNQSVGIIGANGAGKSTFLKLLVGLELNYTGEINVNNLKVEKDNLVQIRKDIGYVFEDVAFAPRNYGFSKEEIEERTIKALKSVGIEELKDKSIYKLSGGQKKLVSIATVLSLKPNTLIFDEPTVALDPKNRRRFINVINSLEGTKIITSHDLDFIYDTCSRTILLSDGKIIKDGDTKSILTNKELLENNGLELPLSMTRRNWY